MTTQKIIVLAIAPIYISLFSIKAVYLGKTVYGDGIYYYSWMRSIIVDRDLSFNHEYAVLGGTQPRTPKGETGNVYPIGPPLLWSPFFLFAHNLIRGDGLSFVYQYITGLVSCLYALVGLALLYRLVFRHFSPSVAIMTLIGIAFGTNLLFYGSLDTVNSHSSSLFLSTIVITLILEQRSPFLIGVFIGLLAATRTQDGIFVILAAPLLVQRRSFMSFSSFILGCLLAFSPQLLAWQALYGTMRKSPYLSEHHYFNFFQPKLIDVLMSPNNGLLLWTPIIGICLAGLVLQKRILFLLVFILQWYLIASWSFWWQGASFSGRMFISLLPVFSLGLGDLLNRLKPKLQVAVILFFLLYNGGAIMLYLLTN